MGADFLLAGVRAESPEKARERLAKLSDNQVMDACEAVLGWDVGEESQNPADECRQRIEYAIDAILVGYEPRDTGTLVIHRQEYIVTGGLSWGDSPTDSFEDVMLLDYSGVCEPMEDE